jgi:hypothetical protein
VETSIAIRGLLAGALLFTLSACGGGGGGGDSAGGQFAWLIPPTEVVDGGPGQDGIPAIDAPEFEAAATITTVEADTLVVVVKHRDEVKAYSHDILDWHEVVNDGSTADPITISYCPLTGSALAWAGDAGQVRRSFGTSGLLYQSNLILYDRRTESRWSQMLQQAVWGERAGELPTTYQVVEMKFSTLQAMYPDALVMTRQTGWSRDYNTYPYGFYLGHEGLLFPVEPVDNRMHLKTRVIGIHSGSTSRVFQRDGFGPTTQALNEQFTSRPIVVVGNSDLDFAAIYDRELSDGTILNFTPLQNDLPNVMTDPEGNVWDVFGTAVSGPRAGEQLEMTSSYTAFWFAWAAFFPDPEIHFN